MIMGKRQLLIHGSELFLFGLLAAIPGFINNPYALGLLTLLAIYGILLIGLDVTVGYLGQVNLAQVAFLGLGAYTAGLSVTLLGMGMLPALLLSLVVGLVCGGVLAFPSLRLEGPQFALGTLSFSALTTTILNEWESLTSGAQGLSIVRPPLFGMHLKAQGFYWLCLGLLALIWFFMKNLLSGRWGRAFEALRDSPIATDAMGVGCFRYKVAAFAFGSSLGSLAGGLYAFNFLYLQPQSFTYDLMVILLLGVVLGGRKSLWGAVIGAMIIVLLPNLLSNRFLFHLFAAVGLTLAVVAAVRGRLHKTTPWFQALAPVIAMGLLLIGGFMIGNTEDWRKAIFALMLFSVVVGLPEGVMGFVGRFFSRLLRMAPRTIPISAPLEVVLPQLSPGNQPILTIDALQRHFGGVKAVDGISLSIRSGQIHGLIGPNGSGKSTVVNVISGLYPPTQGKIYKNGTILPSGSLYRVALNGIARTFQNLQLFGELSALANVMVALRGMYRTPFFLILLGLARSEEQKAASHAMALLELVGLAGKSATPAKDLTYGDQRFLEIARALARRPELLILDEPAAGLSRPDIRQLMQIIRKIHQLGVTIILIEHHMDVVTALCDHVTVLDGGKIIAEGTPQAIKRDPKVMEAYLGEMPAVRQEQAEEGAC